MKLAGAERAARVGLTDAEYARIVELVGRDAHAVHTGVDLHVDAVHTTESLSPRHRGLCSVD